MFVGVMANGNRRRDQICGSYFQEIKQCVLWGYATNARHTGDEDEDTALMEGVTLLW